MLKAFIEAAAMLVGNWISANALFLLMCINFGVLACAIGLAIHAFIFSRRLNRLALASEQKSALIDRLMIDVDAHAQAISSLEACRTPPAATPPIAVAGNDFAVDLSVASHAREGIGSTQEDISSAREDYCDRPRDIPPVPPVLDALAPQARKEIERLKAELTNGCETEAAAPADN